MGGTNSVPVKNNEKFTLRTEVNLVSDREISTTDRQKAVKYLNSPAFKRRAVFDLQSNFVEQKKIKVVIDSIKAQPNLKVVIKGTIKVLKAESELKDMVKSVLEEALPQYSSQGEPMPGGSSHFQIRFKSSETSIDF